ncbi:MAG: hypothetical protein M3Q93_02600 [Gemmatimonadota bacterium]|nr:hypothetical protein [Gemmatimonadota bacterium]
MKPDSWTPPAEMDAKVREWMKAQGYSVNSTRYYFDDEVYAWRHEEQLGSPTLWITRSVLEHCAPTDLAAHLDRLHVAARMRSKPKARFVVVERDSEIDVVVWGHGD